MEKLPPWLAKCYATVKFPGMRNFPHDYIIETEGDWDLDFPFFYGYRDLVVKHLSAFNEYCKKNDFLHEDVMMKFLSMSLKGSSQMWYESLGKCMFSAFAGFLEAFCASWDYDSTGWLPLVH
jgi:hypothetical protein